jgi:AcrR family transcriptional regulator
VSEAIRLFAERGFRGTTVGEIEQAAGLVPRSGGLYKHFPSKEAVLEEATAQRVRDIEAVRSSLDLLPLGDLRAELTLIGRWALSELGAEQPLMKIVMKDGDRFPELVELVRERIVKRGEQIATEVIERILTEEGIAIENPRPLAAVALGSLVAYRIEHTMFGVAPMDVAEDEFIEAWVDVLVSFAHRATAGPVRDKVEATR